MSSPEFVRGLEAAALLLESEADVFDTAAKGLRKHIRDNRADDTNAMTDVHEDERTARSLREHAALVRTIKG